MKGSSSNYIIIILLNVRDHKKSFGFRGKVSIFHLHQTGWGLNKKSCMYYELLSACFASK